MSAYFNAVVYNAVYSACLLNAVYSACLLNAVYSACLLNAVCLYNAYFLTMIYAIAFYFHVLSWFIDTVCLFHVLICIMHSDFNLLVFPKSMFTPLSLFFLLKGLCALLSNST